MLIKVVVPMPTQIIIFATSNPHKFEEVNQLFNRFTNYKIKRLNLEIPELQSLDLAKIAVFALKSLAEIAKEDIDNHPIFVEDSGVFIQALKGFPGPYSSYVYQTLGLNGILSLMDGIIDRNAYFQSTIALQADHEAITFTSRVYGQISHTISERGWGYDPVFIPNNQGGQTYGGLVEQKKYISHRYLATMQLIEFLQEEYKNLEDLT